MKRNVQKALVVLFLAGGLLGIHAQPAAGVKANVYLTVNFVLNGVKQTADNGIAKAHFSNLDLIAAIGTDTSRSFSPAAKLLLKVPVGQDAGPGFVIRDVVNRTNVDFDVPETILWSVQIGNPVDSYRTNSSGITSVSETCIWEFEFQSSRASFDVQGFTTTTLDNHGNQTQRLADVCPVTASSKVVGTGYDEEGNSIVLQGTISTNGRKVVNVN